MWMTVRPWPNRLGIKSIPTLKIFKDGKTVHSITGMASKSSLEEDIKKVIAGEGNSESVYCSVTFTLLSYKERSIFMKSLVVYASQNGKHKKNWPRPSAKNLSGDTLICSVDEAPDPADYDFVAPWFLASGRKTRSQVDWLSGAAERS